MCRFGRILGDLVNRHPGCKKRCLARNVERKDRRADDNDQIIRLQLLRQAVGDGRQKAGKARVILGEVGAAGHRGEEIGSYADAGAIGHVAGIESGDGGSAEVTNASNLTVALNWIDGAWVGAEQVRELINPASYEVIGAYADGGLEAARVAIAAAKRAFQPCCANSTRSWSKCLHGSRCPPAASSFWAAQPTSRSFLIQLARFRRTTARWSNLLRALLRA